MPLFYQQNINQHSRLAIWKIEETEDFFSGTIPLQANITSAHKRLQHFAGRYLLRYLYPPFPYEQILIANTKKPYLESEEVHFSISHCGNYAAAIVSTTSRVGIDIELYTERVEKIAPKFLHSTEHNFLPLNTDLSNKNLLTVLWSCKETMFKWWGNGNVDFKEMMHLIPSKLEKSGTLKAQFNQHPLAIHYQLFHELCLTYTY